MFRYLSHLAIGLFMYSHMATAGELLNVGLRVDLKFQTFGESCHLRSLFRHYNLSLDMSDGHVSKALLTKVNVFGPAQKQSLNAEEVRLFDVRHDAAHRLSWVKSFSASSATLQTLLNTADGLGRGDNCKPPKGLSFENLSYTEFDFVIEEVDHLLPHLIHAKPVILRGHVENGDPFIIEITLTQDRT